MFQRWCTSLLFVIRIQVRWRPTIFWFCKEKFQSKWPMKIFQFQKNSVMVIRTQIAYHFSLVAEHISLGLNLRTWPSTKKIRILRRAHVSIDNYYNVPQDYEIQDCGQGSKSFKCRGKFKLYNLLNHVIWWESNENYERVDIPEKYYCLHSIGLLFK